MTREVDDDHVSVSWESDDADADAGKADAFTYRPPADPNADDGRHAADPRGGLDPLDIEGQVGPPSSWATHTRWVNLPDAYYY